MADDVADVLSVLEQRWPVGTRVRVRQGVIDSDAWRGMTGVVVFVETRTHGVVFDKREGSVGFGFHELEEEYVFTFEELEPV